MIQNEKTNDTHKEKIIPPAVMIAGASSGSGKTMITCALLQTLLDRGYSPVSFKCGPDYIDPMFHRTVLGIDSDNLDTYLAGKDGVKDIFLRASEKGDLAVIEGVMGIYDGIRPGSLKGSCYEVACITNTPIILAVGAKGVGATVISVIKGILADDSEHLIKGIILNRMSATFYEKISPVLDAELKKVRPDVAVLGHIPDAADAGFESRHLGLVLPGEIDDVRERIRRFTKLMQDTCDIDSLEKIMNMSAAEDISSKTRSRSCSGVADARLVKNLVKRRRLHEVFSETLRCTHDTDSRDQGSDDSPFISAFASKTIAIARDEAFCFYYPENLRYLETLGAKLIYFSPIHDEKIPDNADAFAFGGGYPELYLKELSANRSMLSSVRHAIENGKPSIAECGGFMYLHKGIEDRSGKRYDTVGVIDGVCRYTGHLVNFGYTSVKDVKAGVDENVRKALIGMRGHEFHYYESSAPGNDAILCKPSTGKTTEGMYIGPDRLWGWPHMYYRSGEYE